MKTVCFFGSYDRQYPRNRLTRKAFEKLGWRIIYCHNHSSGPVHYWRLVNKFLNTGHQADLIFVGVLGHFDVPLAWILAKIFRKKIVFDAFYSLYDTYIEERQITGKISFAAWRFYLYDWLSIRFADKVILDTKENIVYFVGKYKVNRHKFYELPVTVDPDIFKFKLPQKREVFTVGFYGSFLPLHGVDLIVEAIDLLKREKIKCLLTGQGYGLSQIKEKIDQLKLGDKIIFKQQKILYEKLPNFFQKIDLFLAGPFGNTKKAKRVLPAKVVEALSVGVPTIIRKTATTYRLLESYKRNVIWLEDNKPATLARKISLIMESNSIRNRNSDDSGYFNRSELSFASFKDKFKKIISNEP